MRPSEEMLAGRNLSWAEEVVGLTHVNRRKMSSSRNRFNSIIFEAMRAATNTVDAASMIHVITMSPSPRSLSGGRTFGIGLLASWT
jgi:hypothetical protein